MDNKKLNVGDKIRILSTPEKYKRNGCNLDGIETTIFAIDDMYIKVDIPGIMNPINKISTRFLLTHNDYERIDEFIKTEDNLCSFDDWYDDLFDYNTHKNCKGKRNMSNSNEVVELWYEREKKKLDDTLSSRKREIEESDPFVNKFNTFVTALNSEMKLEDEYAEELPLRMSMLSSRLKDSLKEERNQHREALDELSKKKREILAMLSGCETYEQRMNVLKGYELVIMDTNGVKMQ